MPDREALQAQLAALRETFRAQVGTRIGDLEAAWAAGDFEEVHRLAHKLAGTAGTFGAAQISGLARSLEARAAGLRSPEHLGAEARAEAEEILRRLRESAQD